MEDEEFEGGTTVLERPDEDVKDQSQDDDLSDHDRFSHWVNADRSVPGKKLVALCGKVWTPHNNPKDYPICPKCTEIYNQIMHK